MAKRKTLEQLPVSKLVFLIRRYEDALRDVLSLSEAATSDLDLFQESLSKKTREEICRSNIEARQRLAKMMILLSEALSLRKAPDEDKGKSEGSLPPTANNPPG
jgi:hypothetical protein